MNRHFYQGDWIKNGNGGGLTYHPSDPSGVHMAMPTYEGQTVGHDSHAAAAESGNASKQD